MSLVVHQIKKRSRRPNETHPLSNPPKNIKNFRLCTKHELYSLHNCPRCVVEKREQTMLKRHGVKTALHSKTIMDKKNDTCLERYATIHAMQTDEVKKKVNRTNLQKYGVEHTLQVKEIRQKGTDSMVQKYGVEHASQCKELLEKRVATYNDRYGVDSPLQCKEVLEKRKKTNMDRYQVEEVLKNKGIQQRIQTTMFEKYQVANPLQNKQIRERKDATCEERYGNSIIMHVPELFEKRCKNAFARTPFTLPSGRIIQYQGYEDVALRALLEEHKEDEIVNDVKEMPTFMYEWNGSTHRYYPDIYLPNERKIIEIKSTYTYLSQREQNQAKRECVLRKGYGFEFWICDHKTILYKTDGWETDEDVPWYKSKKVDINEE